MTEAQKIRTYTRGALPKEPRYNADVTYILTWNDTMREVKEGRLAIYPAASILTGEIY